MVHWPLRPLFLVLIALAPSSSAAQGFCGRALADRPFPRIRNATDPHEGGDLYPIVSALSRDRLAKVEHSFGIQPEWFSDSTDIPDTIRVRQPRDSVRRWDAAFQLANLFNGGVLGHTEGMAFAAASLYRYWHLPPEPAAAFLADRAFSFSARTKAVRALEPYWATVEFRHAAAAALCGLAAKAVGLSALGVNDPDSSGGVPLDYEEYEFFSQIMWALGSTQEGGGPSPKDVIALLPPQNALTLWAKKWLNL